MIEEAKRLNLGFSTADASAPQIEFHHSIALITFRDWQETSIKLKFVGVSSLNWTYEDTDADAPYEIFDSPLLKKFKEDHRHFRLCFNGVGILDVIATSLEIVPA